MQVDMYSICFILHDVLSQCTDIKKTIFFLSKVSIKYSLKLIYLITNRINKNIIGYTVLIKLNLS